MQIIECASPKTGLELEADYGMTPVVHGELPRLLTLSMNIINNYHITDYTASH